MIAWTASRIRTKRSGVTAPPTLGTTIRSAPKARIVRSFSWEKASEETSLIGYPLTEQTKASDEPVLPPVNSTTVIPGRRSPRASAPSIIARAMRSL